ncbi:prevent-host-death family protein [Phyllobacterium sp. CL33Tsu]|uniref:type II toxin-antitoxin system prevent-host-death family antitoxin n=1 Tax=Phyllobacterium sp. CL33Tsu TaxID=1798191 RepID=UPI0008F2832E|nr:type II toxin-antitoxin system prevent-host-death family antitoxin [Phyllobacterium sp. CL33Tsu]SFJ39338.1 prevent-host-death family protein [Phyllobacterium sp. CL33Tsu]
MTTKVTAAEFIRKFGRFHDQAQREPVVLTKHGRESVVVLSVATFEKLMKSNDRRRTYGIDETPPELRTMILDELERLDADLANDHD